MGIRSYQLSTKLLSGSGRQRKLIQDRGQFFGGRCAGVTNVKRGATNKNIFKIFLLLACVLTCMLLDITH